MARTRCDWFGFGFSLVENLARDFKANHISVAMAQLLSTVIEKLLYLYGALRVGSWSSSFNYWLDSDTVIYPWELSWGLHWIRAIKTPDLVSQLFAFHDLRHPMST